MIIIRGSLSLEVLATPNILACLCNLPYTRHLQNASGKVTANHDPEDSDVKIRNLISETGTYEARFLVDTSATGSLVPSEELKRIGIDSVGKQAYELANGKVEEYAFSLAEIAFMDEVTAGRVIFGPDGSEPILGVTALESAGITIDPANRTLRKLPSIPLK